MTQPKFPDVQVQLSGEDGNAFHIIGRTRMAMKRAGVSREEIDRYSAEAMAGDYQHVLSTTMATVSVS